MRDKINGTLERSDRLCSESERVKNVEMFPSDFNFNCFGDKDFILFFYLSTLLCPQSQIKKMLVIKAGLLRKE